MIDTSNAEALTKKLAYITNNASKLLHTIVVILAFQALFAIFLICLAYWVRDQLNRLEGLN